MIIVDRSTDDIQMSSVAIFHPREVRSQSEFTSYTCYFFVNSKQMDCGKIKLSKRSLVLNMNPAPCLPCMGLLIDRSMLALNIRETFVVSKAYWQLQFHL